MRDTVIQRYIAWYWSGGSSVPATRRTDQARLMRQASGYAALFTDIVAASGWPPHGPIPRILFRLLGTGTRLRLTVALLRPAGRDDPVIAVRPARRDL